MKIGTGHPNCVMENQPSKSSINQDMRNVKVFEIMPLLYSHKPEVLSSFLSSRPVHKCDRKSTILHALSFISIDKHAQKPHGRWSRAMHVPWDHMCTYQVVFWVLTQQPTPSTDMVFENPPGCAKLQGRRYSIIFLCHSASMCRPLLRFIKWSYMVDISKRLSIPVYACGSLNLGVRIKWSNFSIASRLAQKGQSWRLPPVALSLATHFYRTAYWLITLAGKHSRKHRQNRAWLPAQLPCWLLIPIVHRG